MTTTRRACASVSLFVLALLLVVVAASPRGDGTVLVRIAKRLPHVPPADVVSQMRVVQELDGAWVVRLPIDVVPRLASAGVAHDVFDPSGTGEVLFLVSTKSPDDVGSLGDLGAVWRLDDQNCLLAASTDTVRELVPSHLRLKRLDAVTTAQPTFQLAGVASARPRSVRVIEHAYRPEIAQMVGEVDGARLAETIKKLESFRTRYASTVSCEAAGTSLFDSLAVLPLSAERDAFTFAGAYATNNIIATLPGRTAPDQVVIVAAHYDSYSSAARTDAPGADDNASGTAVVMELARILSFRPFDFTIRFIAFSAEEWGLYGSKHYAEGARNAGEKIIGVVNLDMVGYIDRAPEDLDLVANQRSDWLANAFVSIASSYAPLPTVKIINPSFVYSDHAPFWDQGYSALCGIEDITTPSPYYHKATDTFATLNMDFETSVARASLAVVAALAQPVSSPPAPVNVTVNTQTYSSLFIRARVATVSWSPSSGATGYNVYRSMTSHGPYQRVNTARVSGSSFVDRFLKTATTYYYVVSAVDGSGTEGNYSAEVVVGP